VPHTALTPADLKALTAALATAAAGLAYAAVEPAREYIEYTGSGVFACPPGLGAQDDWALSSSADPVGPGRFVTPGPRVG
jgi:hypothetical protein